MHALCQRTLSQATSTSSAQSRPRPRSRRSQVVVRAADDALCKDKVSLPKAPFQSKGVTYKVTFAAAGGESVVIDCPDDMYILDAADKAGLDLPATCRGGICGSCVARVSVGAVDQSDIQDLSFTLNDDEVAKGMALICMARPQGDCTIETQCDWGYGLGLNEWKGATGKFSSAPDPLMGKSWTAGDGAAASKNN